MEREFWELRAVDLMTVDPVRIHEMEPASRAAEALIENRISGLAVIGDDGRVSGVISRADITRHYGNPIDHPAPFADFYHHALHQLPGEAGAGVGEPGHAPSVGQRTPVAELMSTNVHAVTPDAPVAAVLRELLANRIHRLLVIDEVGALVGIVSAMDVLAALEPPSGD